MSGTKNYRLIEEAPKTTALMRVKDSAVALRSIWLGPWNTKDKALAAAFGASSNASGQNINEYTALTYSAIWAAVNLISSDIAALPLMLYKRESDGSRSRFSTHPLYRLLHDAPNPEMTSMVFRKTIQAHVLTWGNGYAEIERDALNKPKALWLLTPDRVRSFRQTPDSPITYEVYNPLTNEPIYIPARDMLHVAGLSWDGERGYSPIQQAAGSIGLGVAAEKFGGTFFGNGTTLGGIVTFPPGVAATEQAKKNFKEYLNTQHQGVEKAHRFLTLYEGASYQKLGVDPNVAQFLETRQFQVTEVARWYNLPPHKIGDLTRSTNNNIEQQTLDYYTSTLLPWLNIWEQELAAKLISALEQNIQFIEHVTEGFLRADSQARGEFYFKQWQIGAITPNEARELENRNKITGGDRGFVPMNFLPLDRLDEWLDAEIESKKPPPPPVAPPAGPDLKPVVEEKQRSIERLTDEVAVTRRMMQELRDTKDFTIAERDADHAVALQRAHEAQLALIASADTERLRLVGELDDQRTRLANSIHDHTVTMGSLERVDAEASILRQGIATAEAIITTVREAAATRETELLAAIDVHAAAIARLTADTETLTTDRARFRAEAGEQLALATALDADLKARTSERDEQARLLVQRDQFITDVTRDLEAATANNLSLAGTLDAERTEHDQVVLAHQVVETVWRADYTKACAEAQNQTVRADTADAVGAELRVQIAALTAEATERQTALLDARESLATTTARLEQVEALHTRDETLLTAQSHAVVRAHRRQTEAQTAVRGALTYTVQCIIRREADRARHQMGTPEKLTKWIENFYVLHADFCRDALRPVLRAWLAVADSPPPLAPLLTTAVTEYIEDSMAHLRAVVAVHTHETLAPAVETLLRQWEADRAETVADRLCREVA